MLSLSLFSFATQSAEEFMRIFGPPSAGEKQEKQSLIRSIRNDDCKD